jgi:hypothetical protein
MTADPSSKRVENPPFRWPKGRKKSVWQVCHFAVKPFGNSQKGIGSGWLTWQRASAKYPRHSITEEKPMFRTKTVVAAIAVATMIASSAFAAEPAPLAAGKPSGVQKAQIADLSTGTIILGLGAIAIITAIAITVGNQSGNHVATGSLGQGGSVSPGTAV